MVTLIEINKAINDKIYAALAGTAYSTVPIMAEDISEPIKRPSIKVQIENTANSKFNSSCREKTLTCRIYYFASERKQYKIENLKMQDILETAFMEDLEVTDSFYIPIDEVNTEVIDTVLECSFDLYTVELLPEITTDIHGETIEDMEELNINI